MKWKGIIWIWTEKSEKSINNDHDVLQKWRVSLILGGSASSGKSLEHESKSEFSYIGCIKYLQGPPIKVFIFNRMS
jgi:hypothetical protein